MPSKNSGELAKKISLWGGATLVVITLSQTLGGLAVRTILLPALAEGLNSVLAEQREAQARIDSTQAVEISRQKIVIAMLLSDPTPAERRELLKELTTGWARFPAPRRR